MVQGEELLIAEPVDSDRKGLRKLFDAEGYVSTAANDMAHACDMVQRKFFPVALVDLDFDGTNRGLDLIRFIYEHSTPTRIVLMSGRRSYEAAVDALRFGVVDIVTKRSDQVEHLRSAVRLALDRSHSGNKQLVREVRGLLDDALNIMVGLHRKLHPTDVQSASGVDMKPLILIVDDDRSFLEQTANLLGDKHWEVSVEMSGGAGLERATTFGFQILCVREELDLPGNMVIRAGQKIKTNTLGLLYSQQGAGRIDRYQEGQSTHSDSPFRGPQHLVERMSALVAEIAATREQNRYLQVFRSEYGPFLKRYAQLKTRIDSLSE